MNTRQRAFIIGALVWLLIAGYANAQVRGWYDVPAVNKSIGDQVVAVAGSGVRVQLTFLDIHFWDSPALHNVHGWFTPQEALCLALAGTPMVPVPLHDGLIVLHRRFPNEPQRCEYATVDFGPQWIHPPQADWK